MTPRIQELKVQYEHLISEGSDQRQAFVSQITILRLLAEEYAEIGAYKEAIGSYREAAELQKAIGDRNRSGLDLLFDLASVHAMHGMFKEARFVYKQSLDVALEENYAAIYLQIGNTYTALQKWEDAFANYMQALEWSTQTGDHLTGMRTHMRLGQAYRVQKQWSRALTHYKTASLYKREMGDEGRTNDIGR